MMNSERGHKNKMNTHKKNEKNLCIFHWNFYFPNKPLFTVCTLDEIKLSAACFVVVLVVVIISTSYSYFLQ
jgi:hypothetical protein